MSPGILLAFTVFALVAGITPGPNNAMLLSSGVHFGFRRSVPHMLGVVVGFPLMVSLIGLGLSDLFEQHAGFYTALRYISTAYLLYLAWKIANAGPFHNEGPSKKKPMTFLQAFAFQWVNPKCWIMALGAVTAYTIRAHFLWSLFLISVLFAATSVICASTWLGSGTVLRGYLRHPRAARIFNVSMALLLVASLVPIFRETAAK